MAGVPKKVVDRANEILASLEGTRDTGQVTGEENKKQKIKSQKEGEMQLSFFQLNDPVLTQIKDDILQTDINTLTPVEALMKLNEIKKLIGG
jgi:DNA mismatch repair protein MutS